MNAIQLRQETLDVSIRPDAISARDEALDAAATIHAIADEMDEAEAADVLKQLVGMSRGVEETRKAIKAPLIEAGRKIDGCATAFSSPIDAAVTRIKGLLGTFDQARRARVAAEELARQAEAKRIADEKARADAELARQQQEAQEAAQRAQDAASAAFLAEDPASQEKAATEAKAAQEQATAQAALIEQAKADKARADAAQLQLSVQSREKAPAKPKGISSRQVWKFEVVDIRALYAERPDLVTLEPKGREIERVVSAGVELPGVRAWKETEVGVRV